MRAFASPFPAELATDTCPSIAGADLPLSRAVDTAALQLRPQDSAAKTRDLFVERSVTRALIVGVGREPLGSLTASDLLAAGDLDELTVDDVMCHLVFILPAQGSLSQAAALMAYEGVEHLAVVAPDGRALGLVTAADVARWLGHAAGYVGLPPLAA